MFVTPPIGFVANVANIKQRFKAKIKSCHLSRTIIYFPLMLDTDVQADRTFKSDFQSRLVHPTRRISQHNLPTWFWIYAIFNKNWDVLIS